MYVENDNHTNKIVIKMLQKINVFHKIWKIFLYFPESRNKNMNELNDFH